MPPPPPRAGLFRALRVIALTTLGVTLVGSALLGALEGFAQAGQRLERLHPLWLGVALLVWSSSALIQGFRWHALIPWPHRPPPWKLGWILFGSNVLNLAFPGPVGELGAAGFLRMHYQIPLSVGLVSTVVARLWALVVFGGVVLGLWPVLGERVVGMGEWLTPLVGALGAILVPAVVVIGWPVVVIGGIRKVVSKIGNFPKILDRLGFWEDCFQEVGGLGWARHLQAIGWAVVNTGVLGIAGWFCFRAADISGSPLGIVFLQSITALMSVLAIIFPSGLGAVDAMFIAAFPAAAPGLSIGDAVLCAMTVRVVQLGSLALGLPAMLSLVGERSWFGEQKSGES